MFLSRIELKDFKSYETALESSDLSSGLRLVLARQMDDVLTAYIEVKALRDAHQTNAS